MSFAAGQLVRCIDPENGIWFNCGGLVPGPKRGDCCMVTGVEVETAFSGDRTEFLVLAGFGEHAFFGPCFRPIGDEETERLRGECLGAAISETV